MQSKTIYDTGIYITVLLFSFSAFIVVTNPVRFSWITALSSFSMLYFATKKLKHEKKTGQSTEKAQNIIILSTGAAIISTACFIASFYM